MSELRLTHIGGPTVLLEFEGWRLLTDPTFDPAGRRYFFGWGTTSRKLTGPSTTADEIGPIDAVLVSHHQHGDNLDDEGQRRLPEWGPVLTTVKAATRISGTTVGLRPEDTHVLEADGKPTITVTATPCRHGPAGFDPIVGPVVGFDLRWPGQRHGSVWVTGDTVMFPGLRRAAAGMEVGTLIPHLGSVRFRYLSGWLRYTMDAREALELIGLTDPQAVVPVHYEGWSHFQQDRPAAEQQMAGNPLAARVTWVDPGDAHTLEA